MDFKIEEMNSSHIEEVYLINKVSLKLPWTLDAFKKELTNPIAKYLVITIDSKVVGFAGFWNIVNEGHITNIAISPNYRGKGLGKALVNNLIEFGTSMGVLDFTLEVRETNIIAQNLYSSCGFKEEGIRPKYYEDTKESAILMWHRNKESEN